MNRERGVLQLAIAFTLIGLPAGGVSAQDGRVVKRFPPAVATRVNAVVDSAQREGLPTEPIVLRALEGNAKGIPPERIIDALGRLRVSLRTARTTLGPDAGTVELTTAAAALQAGVSEPRIAELHRLRGTQTITAPLGAYLDLVARGAEPELAWSHVADLARRRAADGEFVRLKPRDLDRSASSRPATPTLPGKP
jgi:hypothetical protein